MKKIVGLTAVLLLLMPMGSITALADSTEPVAEAQTETLVVSFTEPEEGEIISETPEESVEAQAEATTAPVEEGETFVEEDEVSEEESEVDAIEDEASEALAEGTEGIADSEASVETETDPVIKAASEEPSVSTLSGIAPLAFTGNPYAGDFIGWTPAAVGDLVTNEFTRHGVTFEIESTITDDLLFANVITNTSTGVSNTYAYDYGSASTSSMYLSTDGGTTYVSATMNTTNYYTLTDPTDSAMAIAKKGTLSGSGVDLDFVEVMTVTAAGEIQHYFTITNSGTTTYTSLQIISMLDTELNGDDGIPIYTDGSGNSYIEDNLLTLFNKVLSTANTTQYAGEWSNPGSMVLTSGPNGSTIVDGVDSAIYYVTDASGLAPDAVIEFSFQESLFTEGEALYTVTVTYVDENENELLPPSTSTGTLGASYSLAMPAIPGYIFSHSVGNISGTYTAEPQYVVFHFKKGTLPNPNEPVEKPIEKPAKDEPAQPKPTPIAVKKDAPAKPGEPTPVAAKAEADADPLPPTGEAKSTLAYVAGAFLIALSGFGFFRKSRKDKE